MAERIVSARIHPAIGIARVGNSTASPFIGPESPDAKPHPPGFYKDAEGAIRRQAARFRVYGYDESGKVVRELTPGRDGVRDIVWTVHLANRKPAWYMFSIPYDIPEAAKLPPERCARRNADVKGNDRKRLVNDPGPRTVHGSRQEIAKFDTGTVMGVTVPLGEIVSSGDGRLLVAGGFGKSASWENRPITGVTNNDTWFDDVSDGPVTATVRLVLDGKETELVAEPAWVVVAPPHYAPNVKTIRTLYDALFDVFVQQGMLRPPSRVSFADHVEPILQRFCDLQWVNHGFATQFGWNGPQHFLRPDLRRRLADPSDTNRELRRQVYVELRDYERDGMSPVPWPWLYGDAMTIPPTSVRQHLTLSATQDWILQKWAAGDFDSTLQRKAYPDVNEAPIELQPELLDRAALENCAADAFHPGCEVTWPIRHATMYSAPFRIKHRSPNDPEPDYGDELLPAEALGVNGPLHAQPPGGLTRWMAAPWQTDTASCRSGYERADKLGPRYSPYLPTFWPAQVPNHVLKETDFRIVNDPHVDVRTREQAFERRAVWLRGLNLDDPDLNKQRQKMVTDWYKFGIVEVRDYTVGDGRFPDKIQVESTPEPPLDQAPDLANLVNLHVPTAAPFHLGPGDGGSVTEDMPEAETVDAQLVDWAVEEAARRTGRPREQIAAGYLERLDPLRERS